MQHQPSTFGKAPGLVLPGSNCAATLENASIFVTSVERTKSHWSALGQPRSSQRPVGDQAMSLNRPSPVKTVCWRRSASASTTRSSLRSPRRRMTATRCPFGANAAPSGWPGNSSVWRRRPFASKTMRAKRPASLLTASRRLPSADHSSSDGGGRAPAGGPARLAAVGRDHVHRPAAIDVGEDVLLAGLPRRRNVPGQVDPAVPGLVAGDDAQAASAQIRDAEAARRPARMPDAPPGEDPAQFATRSQGDELVPLDRADVQPVRRPRRFVIGAEVSSRTVRGDHPDAARRRDQHASLGREREQTPAWTA